MQRWVASKKLPDTRKTFLALALTSIASIIHLMCLIAQFSSVIQSCLNLCNPMDCSTPGLPGHHQLLIAELLRSPQPIDITTDSVQKQ